MKRVGGGMLLQTADRRSINPGDLSVVSRKAPTPSQLAEVQPPKADPKPPPPAATVQTSSSNPVDGEPDDPEFEDGNGS